MYQFLTEEIVKIIQTNIPVYFITDHKNLKDIIQNNTHELVDLTNIDHHHDIGYQIENWKLPLKNYNCGNWVKACWDAGYLNSYTWVHNETSVPVEDKKGEEKYLTESIVLSKYGQIADKRWDMLVLCASWEWIPGAYHPLFYLWQNLYSTLSGHVSKLDKW